MANDLIGAMYTQHGVSRGTIERARFPSAVAAVAPARQKLCRPSKELRGHAELTKFGLQGSIASQGSLRRGRAARLIRDFRAGLVHVYPV